MLGTELVEVIPRKNAGVAQIVEFNPDGVIADRFQFHDPDMGTAVDQCLLSRTVPLHLRGWALDAQVLGGKAKVAAVLEGDLEQLFRPLQAEFHRPTSRSARAHLSLPALTWASR